LEKSALKKTFLDFKKWVKSIQPAGYNGARTVLAKVLLMLAADDKIPNEMAPELLVKSTWL
jgi:hypothetical protein